MNVTGTIGDKFEDLIVEMERLCELESMFVRWHSNMSKLVEQNNSLKKKNNRLTDIAKVTRVHALNARIAAGKAAGSERASFEVVSREITELSINSINLSQSYLENLNVNELLTVETFQDIQAGGRIIITKIQELLNKVKDIQSAFRNCEELV